MATPSSQLGQDVALGPSPSRVGRFGFVFGPDHDVTFDDTRAHSVVASVVDHRLGYWADPTEGSDLFRLRSLSSRAPSQAEAAAVDGLSTMVRAGDVQGVAVAARAFPQSGKLSLDVTWKSPDGQVLRQTLEI
jgi:phage gp46-like protein